MGTVSHKGNLEVTVSECKEGIYAVFQPGRDIFLQSQCNWKMFAAIRSTRFPTRKESASGKSKWCDFFSAHAELWMNYLSQWHGGNGPQVTQKYIMDLGKFRESTMATFANFLVQTDFLELLFFHAHSLLCLVFQLLFTCRIICPDPCIKLTVFLSSALNCSTGLLIIEKKKDNLKLCICIYILAPVIHCCCVTLF